MKTNLFFNFFLDEEMKRIKYNKNKVWVWHEPWAMMKWLTDFPKTRRKVTGDHTVTGAGGGDARTHPDPCPLKSQKWMPMESINVECLDIVWRVLGCAQTKLGIGRFWDFGPKSWQTLRHVSRRVTRATWVLKIPCESPWVVDDFRHQNFSIYSKDIGVMALLVKGYNQ